MNCQTGGLSVRGWLVLSLMLTTSSAFAQEPSSGSERPTSRLEQAGISGSIRGGYWSSTRNLDSEEPFGSGMIWLKSTKQLSPHVSFLIEGWTALRGPASDGEATGEVREAFVDFRFGQLDVRVGRQIIAWGRADGVNPTDNLTGEDLTLLTPDDDDRRLGTTAVRASYYLGGLSFAGIWLPEFRGHRFPLPPAPGMTLIHERPDWPGDQWALRAEQTGRAVDWSLSYFRGRDLTPDLGARPAPPTFASAAAISLSHRRVRAFGGDIAANLGDIGLRVEGAYVDTEDADGRNPFVKNPFVFIVVGGDRTFGEYLNLNVQYVYRFVRDSRAIGDELAPTAAGIAELQTILNTQTQPVQHGA